MNNLLTVSEDQVDTSCLSLLNHEQTVGMSFVAQSGLISSTAVFIFLLLVLKNYIKNTLDPPPSPWKLVRTHVDAYMLSLMVADLLQGVGAIMTVRWTIEKKVYCSGYCTTQGLMQQLGETGVALSTIAITLHTFFTVFFHYNPPQWVWMVVVSAIWTFIGGFIAISYFMADVPFYAPTPFWCWINEKYDAQRLFGEYLWIWLAAFANITIYIPLFFCVRGNIDVHPQTKRISFNFGWWRRFRVWWDRRTPTKEVSNDSWELHSNTVTGPRSRWAGSREESGGGELKMRVPSLVREKQREALKLIWYPISYTALVLPMSVVRWSFFPQHERLEVPIAEMPVLKTTLTAFIFGLSGECFENQNQKRRLMFILKSKGLVNVLVFMSTRPNLLLFGPRRGMVNGSIRTEVVLSPPSSQTPGAASDMSHWPLTKSPGYPMSPYGGPTTGSSTSKSPGYPFSIPGTPAFLGQYTPTSPYGSPYITSSPSPFISVEHSRRHDVGLRSELGSVKQRLSARRRDSGDVVILQDPFLSPQTTPSIQLQRPPERARRKSSLVRGSSSGCLRSATITSVSTSEQDEIRLREEGVDVEVRLAAASVPRTALIDGEMYGTWTGLENSQRLGVEGEIVFRSVI